MTEFRHVRVNGPRPAWGDGFYKVRTPYTPRTVCGAPITGLDCTVADARTAKPAELADFNICTVCANAVRPAHKKLAS